MSGLGAAMTGGNRGQMSGEQSERAENDFYPTPREVTEALLSVWTPPGVVWEPACGDGSVSRVLESHGHDVVSTDLINRGFGKPDVNFLGCDKLTDCIVTNPPFSLAEDFIRKARLMGVNHMALLLKSTYWHASSRLRLFKSWRPSRVYALSWRVDFKDQGAPVMECSWFIWEPGALATVYDVLPKPSGPLFSEVD